MSFSKPVTKQSARVTGKKTSNMRSSSPQAKHSVKSSSHHHKSHDASPSTKQPQPDSGFFDGSDGEHYGDARGNNISYYGNDADWVLFAEDQSIIQDEGYYFDEDDAVDIASTKANHGSLYKGQNNESNTLAPTRSDRPALDSIHENAQGTNPPHHFTYHPTTQAGITQLKSWTHTFEQHESIAYRFEQPPNPAHVFHDLQQSWHEDIDLDLYAVLF